MRIGWIALLGVLWATTTVSAGMPQLKRGVNLSHWYAQTMTGHYEESHLGTYNTEADAQRIKEMGFDHVRWTLNPKIVWTDTPGKLNEPAVAKMKSRIAWFTNRQLAVLIDLHPDAGFADALAAKDSAAREAFYQNWAALAGALSDIAPEQIAFEVLNEPQPLTGDAWRDVQWGAVQAIRKAAPQHAIIVNPGQWSSATELAKFRAYDFPNLIYTFHYYDPMHFTHQGASWTGESIFKLHDLPWPVDPSQAKPIADRSGDRTKEGHKDIHWQILQAEFTPEHMRWQLDAVAVWQRKSGNVPVLIGEFGVYKETAPRESLLAWRKAARTEFEQRGWAWTTWDYAGGFSVVDPKTREPDGEMLKALGLK